MATTMLGGAVTAPSTVQPLAATFSPDMPIHWHSDAYSFESCIETFQASHIQFDYFVPDSLRGVWAFEATNGGEVVFCGQCLEPCAEHEKAVGGVFNLKGIAGPKRLHPSEDSLLMAYRQSLINGGLRGRVDVYQDSKGYYWWVVRWAPNSASQETKSG